jgi:hypothetical protein
MYLNWELLLFPCILPYNNNGNSVPMRPDSFLTMGTAFPRVPPRNDHWCPVAPIPGGQGGQRTLHFLGQGVKPRLTIRQR